MATWNFIMRQKSRLADLSSFDSNFQSRRWDRLLARAAKGNGISFLGQRQKILCNPVVILCIKSFPVYRSAAGRRPLWKKSTTANFRRVPRSLAKMNEKMPSRVRRCIPSSSQAVTRFSAMIETMKWRPFLRSTPYYLYLKRSCFADSHAEYQRHMTLYALGIVQLEASNSRVWITVGINNSRPSVNKVSQQHMSDVSIIVFNCAVTACKSGQNNICSKGQ